MSGGTVWAENANMNLDNLVGALVQEGADAVVLLGSVARQEDVAYSDLDIHALFETPPQDHQRIFYLADRLVAIGFVRWDHKEQAFRDPQTALWNIAGIQQSRILHDPEGRFAALQERAFAFDWSTLQEECSSSMGSRFYNLIEECHKIMGGLTTHNPEKCFFALEGLRWSLAEMGALASGVLIETENRYFSSIRDAHPDPEWRHHFDVTVGVTGMDPFDRGVAGLKLYLRSFELYGHHMQEAHQNTVLQAVQTVRDFLGNRGVDKNQKD